MVYCSGFGVHKDGFKRLEYYGWKVKLIKHPIWNPNNNDNDNNDFDPEQIDFNRLWIWSLVEYDKVIFLDYNIMVLKDICELFDIDVWSESPDQQFAASSKTLPNDEFDARLLLIKPDVSLFTEMLSQIKTGDIDPSVQDFGDLLNSFFPHWYEMRGPHRLRPIYNTPYLWTEDETVWKKHRSKIKVFNFGDTKPWKIINDPSRYRVSKFAAPLLYVWSLLRFFVSLPTGNSLEEEARYVFREVFDITKSSKTIIEYMERMKRGGTRRRVEL